MDLPPATAEEERRNRALRLVNAHIGRRARERRAARALSQDDVAQMIGMSHQQVQKYESGDSAIAAARMVQLALALRADPRDFLEGLPPEAYEGLGFVPPAAAAPPSRAPGGVGGFAEEQAGFGGPPPKAPPAAAPPIALAEFEALRDAYLAIGDEGKRRLLLDMARALASG